MSNTEVTKKSELKAFLFITVVLFPMISVAPRGRAMGSSFG